MGKKYTITLIVEDVKNQYGDSFTLDHYFTDTTRPATDALDLKVITTTVNGKR